MSAATVSRVFNGGRFTAELAERVLRSAAELRFAPNRVARALRMQRSSVISLIIPDIANPYFTALARGVEDAAQGKNHSVVLCNSDEDLDKERRYLDTERAEQMAGVIIAAASRSHTDLSPFAGMPVVAVDRRPLGAAVVMDRQRVPTAAARHPFALQPDQPARTRVRPPRSCTPGQPLRLHPCLTGPVPSPHPGPPTRLAGGPTPYAAPRPDATDP
ncbi:LacI family DNA-binding transcriptional regulator [Streptomyces sp. NPDC056491]|uniref:LacI family DNA-binding transcriptional regulator n=1 Tax=Streptomyces sp. NPDC056491 TaxID=3345837 RepID=UPI0036B3B762